MTDVGVGTRKGRLTPLWVMILIFAAPSLAAWFFYLNPQYLPGVRSNRGELIQPAVELAALGTLLDANGSTLDLTTFDGRWTLVFLAGADCADPCRARLADLRQIRLATGEGQMAVERLLILTRPVKPNLLVDLGGDFPGMRIVALDATAAGRLLDALGQGEAALARVYVLDPMGRLMMRYAADAPAKDTLKDLERLIKASKNWIKGAGYGHK
jgi:hypothetical protein